MKFKPKSEDTRNYVKIKSGESVTGAFRGEPFEFRVHWNDNRSSVCPGDTCDLCTAGSKATFKFRVNFIVKSEDGYEAKVLEQGWRFYEDLRTLNEEYSPIENHIFKISRQGEKFQTKYSIFPIPNGNITADKEALISQVGLNDLGHISQTETEPPSIEDSDLGNITF